MDAFQERCQEANLGGFAAPFDSFEGNEKAQISPAINLKNYTLNVSFWQMTKITSRNSVFGSAMGGRAGGRGSDRGGSALGVHVGIDGCGGPGGLFLRKYTRKGDIC
jgi:hypothetical protein